MQAITLFIAFALSFVALADQPGASNGRGRSACITGAAGYPIHSTYVLPRSTVINSLVAKGNLRLRNLTSTPIAVNWSHKQCGDATRDDAFVMSNETTLVERANIQDGGSVCARSLAGADITGGNICVDAW